MESGKIVQMNLLKSRNRDTDRYMDTKVGKGEWDQLENWDSHIWTCMCKIDNWWEPPVWETTQCLVVTKKGYM